MRLLDNAASPYAFKVRVTLYEKGIPFEKHEIRYQSDRVKLLKVNPRGEVPALQDGEAVIYDSRVICEYLEEKYPKPALLPADPALRARCRTLENVSDDQLDPCVVLIGTLKLFRPELESKHPEALRHGVAALEKHYANLDRELAGRSFIAGDFSRADIAIYPHLSAAAFMGCPVGGEHENLAGWLARMSERPSIAQATGEALASFSETPPAGEESLFNPQHLHWRGERIEWLVRAGLGPWLLEEIAGGRAFFSPVP
jgi:glutathione S-transferase